MVRHRRQTLRSSEDKGQLVGNVDTPDVLFRFVLRFYLFQVLCIFCSLVVTVNCRNFKVPPKC